VVAHRLGLCDSQVTVHMPGGELAIEVSPTYDVRMTGPVAKVAEGRISDELFEAELPPGALPPLPADVPEPTP
jgi:diaminopimelate epimerase